MKHRGLLSMAALLAVAVIGGIGGWTLWNSSLPHPANANRDQLLHWMVLRDLPSESEEINLALVDRIQTELGSGIDTSGSEELSESYKLQLQANIRHLEEVWFRARCRQYDQLARVDRFVFLTEQIDFLMMWAELDTNLNKSEAAIEQRFEFTKDFFDKVGNWVERSEGEEAQRMQQGVQDGVLGWLAGYNLASEPQETQVELANRIVEQLDAGMSLDAVPFDLDEQQDVQLQQNVELLLQEWIYEQAEIYHALAPSGRKELLNDKVSNITNWKIGSLLNGNKTAAAAKNNPMKLLADVEKWVKAAPPNKQLKVQRLVNDVKQVLFFKYLGGLMKPK